MASEHEERPGWFHPPFRSGWLYLGATHAGHTGYAVDFNRRTATGGWLQDKGDPVLASADGTVAVVDVGDGLVMLNHHAGLWRTEHRHMSDILVKGGDKVRRGDRIGSIGSVRGDGRSTGPHLHHVHWRRAGTGAPWTRTKMRFLGVAVPPSVHDSDTRPTGWRPPPSHMVEGPMRPPRPLPDHPRYQQGYDATLEAIAIAAAIATPVEPWPGGVAFAAGMSAARAEAIEAIEAISRLTKED